MKDRLFSAVASAPADYVEIRWETNDSTSAAYRGKEMDSVGSSLHEGGIVRACVKGGWGTSVFDTLDDLPRRVAQACANAALVGHETTELAPVQKPIVESIPAQLITDFRGVPLDDKLALIGRYNGIILGADRAIESTMVAYMESFRTVHFANSEGAYFHEERPRVVLYLMGVGRDRSLVQRASESFSSATDYNVVLGHDALAEEVGQRAARLLKAPQCKGGPQTVVLRPDFAGVFAHEAFGHLSEADFLYENPKMRELMKLGREMGPKELSIIDDGSLAGRTGSIGYDDEGTPASKTTLIGNGILTGHLHSRETAAKMGEKPTGNARAIARGCEPIVRMTNTYIDAGPLTRDELFAGVDDGLYCCGMVGGQTMMEMFTFSAAYGYRIHNGQIGELVRDITLTGNVFETLHRIDGLANDLEIRESGGGCGKGGQSPLPVTFGGPHVRIRDVVVGGN